MSLSLVSRQLSSHALLALQLKGNTCTCDVRAATAHQAHAIHAGCDTAPCSVSIRHVHAHPSVTKVASVQPTLPRVSHHSRTNVAIHASQSPARGTHRQLRATTHRTAHILPFPCLRKLCSNTPNSHTKKTLEQHPRHASWRVPLWAKGRRVWKQSLRLSTTISTRFEISASSPARPPRVSVEVERRVEKEEENKENVEMDA